ncbi:hypothetical protein GX48_05329 [Paracoccidioides brasiliensis]|nr:hypothetical protein GX48_05329 [Paracoccidioides brasiliensis]
MPDETFTSANDSYAIEGLAQQIVLEARSDWAGIFALTGALGYGTRWLSKSSIVRVATQTGLEGINACNIAFDCKYERIQGEWDKYEGGMKQEEERKKRHTQGQDRYDFISSLKDVLDEVERQMKGDIISTHKLQLSTQGPPPGALVATYRGCWFAPVSRPILPNLLARLSQLRCSSMRTLHDSRMQWLKKFVPRRQISRLVLG